MTVLNDPGQADRQSRGIPVVPVFDGYRALAILGIVIFHLLPAGPSPDSWVKLQNATFGQLIDVLFIVSGFVVFLPTAWQGRFGSVRSYAVRRAARLLPAYYMILLLALLIGLIGKPLSPTIHPSASEIALHFTGLQTLGTYFENTFGPVGFAMVGPVWTLSVEISFYLILPLVAMAFYRHPRIGLLIAAAIGVAWGWSGIHSQEIADWLGTTLNQEEIGRIARNSGLQFPFWIFSFALGMAGAKLYVRAVKDPDQDRVRRYAGRALVLGLVGLTIAAIGIYNTQVEQAHLLLLAEIARTKAWIMLLFSASLATVMVAIALGPVRLRWPFDNGPIRWLAEVSYGVYLSHALLIWVAAWGFGFFFEETWLGLGAWLATILPLSVLYGYLSARFLEQPIRRWARKYGREPASPAASGEPET